MVKDTNWAANEWVEAWVEQARDAGLVELDLSDRNLTLLPENLFEYENLQGLSLDTNRLKLLDKKIGNLVNLEYLDLSNNEIEYLPNEIEKLTSLVVLNIDLNYLKDLPRAIKNLKNLQSLGLSDNKLIIFPKDIYSLNRLKHLDLSYNKINQVPDSIAKLHRLKHLDLSYNKINQVPDSIAKLHRLEFFDMSGNKLKTLPNIFENLTKLKELNLSDNDLATLPESLVSLDLQALNLDNNPFEPELLAAYEEGIKTTLAYLRAKAESKVILNEGKLILVGEGEVGKSCLLGALRGDEWVENRLTTHGIEIKPCQLIYSDTEITLNGWDFGGQPVYRPTHQLFFSSPAVYLVVWKPREGPQQGFVEYWITLIKRRAPEAKIIVVATHGGPNQRQPDIDRQILIDKFGQDTLIGFFFVNSKPDENSGITELKHKIAEVAYQLPEMGRTVPTKWQKVREELKNLEQAYLPYQDVIDICETVGMEQEQAKLFLKISHILGHLIYYEIDPTLGDIVILKPDWLAKAISFVLDDHETRISKGLIEFERLSNLWQHPPHKDEKGNPESGYPESLHPIFLRLMERFDLSYRIKINGELTETSLIAQLVPDNRPETLPNWETEPDPGDKQQIQICRIVDETGQQANAEGLFYQLIVRLHQYSLGRENYPDSVHWQRGLMLGDRYNGRALLEHIGTDIKITVRAAYPERFLSRLTEEVESLFDPKNPARFWKGLRCQIMVPCIAPCGLNQPGRGLFEIEKLINRKQRNKDDYPCNEPNCNEDQNIDCLLRNAPASDGSLHQLIKNTIEKTIDNQFEKQNEKSYSYYLLLRDDINKISPEIKAELSKRDQKFDILMQALTDEAKEGPRLFSIIPVDPKFWDSPKWLKSKFQIILWCEHSRLPLTFLNPADSKLGIYEVEISREWFTKAKPLIKTITTTLSLVLPVAASFNKFVLDENAYKTIEEQLDLGQKALESTLKTSELLTNQTSDTFDNTKVGNVIEAQGSFLRELHAIVKQKDPNFSNLGLERVQNKQGKFLWVHPQFISEY